MVSELKIVDPLKEPKAGRKSLVLREEGWIDQRFGDPLKDDFRVFASMIWRHLGLPGLTELQQAICWEMQHHKWNGTVDRLILEAFRGAAKSYITAAYVLWVLHRHHQHKAGVFSGSALRAVNFVNFCLSLIREVPTLQYLAPKPTQRSSSSGFDVGPAMADQTPSVFALGITSAVVGFRADVIVADDVETNKNSLTPDMRERLSQSVKEFDAIVKPGGQIIFLGTPQTEASIYNGLEKRGYRIVVFPALYPTLAQRRRYGARLAQYVAYRLDQNPKLVGTSTEPGRFSDEALAERALAWGKAGFSLQYMLDTSLADAGRYPLRMSNATVMALDRRMGPDRVVWGSGEHLRLRDVSPIALDGDALYGPASVSQGYSAWPVVYGFIDPSGKGADETTLTIGAALSSTLFVLKQAGWQDGYGEDTLKEMAALIVDWNVGRLRVEEDYGQGMFAQLLKPHIQAAWDARKKADRAGQDLMAAAMAQLQGNAPTGSARLAGGTLVESERAAKVQKELRILEALEPLFDSHRIVFSKSVLEEDIAQVNRRDGSELRDRYSLMYQITRLTRERDSLTHDDRVEGLGGLALMFAPGMGLLPAEQAEDAIRRRTEEQLAAWDRAEGRLRGESERDADPRGGRLGSGRRRA